MRRLIVVTFVNVHEFPFVIKTFCLYTRFITAIRSDSRNLVDGYEMREIKSWKARMSIHTKVRWEKWMPLELSIFRFPTSNFPLWESCWCCYCCGLLLLLHTILIRVQYKIICAFVYQSLMIPRQQQFHQRQMLIELRQKSVADSISNCVHCQSPIILSSGCNTIVKVLHIPNQLCLSMYDFISSVVSSQTLRYIFYTYAHCAQTPFEERENQKQTIIIIIIIIIAIILVLII